MKKLVITIVAAVSLSLLADESDSSLASSHISDAPTDKGGKGHLLLDGYAADSSAGENEDWLGSTIYPPSLSEYLSGIDSRRLFVLDCGNKGISEIDRLDAEHKAQALYLEGNCLQYYCHTIEEFPNLRLLNLSGNQLHTVQLGKPSGITSLDVSKNPVLTELNLSKLKKLSGLNISGTGLNLESLKGIQYCKELKRIDISGTSIADTELQKLLPEECVIVNSTTSNN